MPGEAEAPSTTWLYQQTARVRGQDHARRALATLLRRQMLVGQGHYGEAHGALAAGNTGTGKTMLIKMMCGLSGIPFAAVNATKYTDAGYVGLNLEQMFLPLIRAAAEMVKPPDPPPAVMDMMSRRARRKLLKDRDNPASVLKLPEAVLAPAVELAETGVVMLDEFDKWMLQASFDPAGKVRRKPGTDGEGRNVGRKLQAELLKLVEDDECWVSDDESQLGLSFSTKRVLIICAGAFTGIDQILSERLELDVRADPAIWEKTEPVDFERYGLMPELAGRLSTHIMFKPLREEHYLEILQEEGGTLDEFHRRFADEECELVIDQGGLTMLAQEAMRMGVGARGLRHMMERVCNHALFDAAMHPGAGHVELHSDAASHKRAQFIPHRAKATA